MPLDTCVNEGGEAAGLSVCLCQHESDPGSQSYLNQSQEAPLGTHAHRCRQDNGHISAPSCTCIKTTDTHTDRHTYSDTYVYRYIDMHTNVHIGKQAPVHVWVL